MSQNIKNNLFRFVTLRSPQLIDEKDKQRGFIYPDEGTGIFLPPLNAALEGEKKQALLDAKDSFANSPSLLEKKTDVRGLNENLYNFSSWLMRNKNALSYAEILDNISEVEELGGDEQRVWDNLIYQTLTRSSVYIRESLIQLLIANKFLLYFEDFSQELTEVITFTEDQEKEFSRLANASVVIPKKVLLETYNDTPVSTKSKQANAENQKRLCDLLTARYDKVALKKLTNELTELQKSYKTQEAASYKLALDNHQKDVDAVLNAGTVQLVDQWDIETQAYIQVEKLVHGVLPKFTYAKATEIDTQELQTALSATSYKYLTDNKLDTLTSYDTILKAVDRLSKEKYNKAEQLMPKTGKSVIKGGVFMRLEDPFKEVLTNFGDVDSHITHLIEDDVPADFIPPLVASDIYPYQIDPSSCYTVNVVAYASAKTESGDRDWRFVVGVTYNDEISSIAAVDQSLSFTNDANIINSTSFEVSNTIPDHSKIRLFDDLGSISKPLQVGNPILSGTVTLANGTELVFSETIEMMPFLKQLRGSAILDFDCEEDEATEETPATFGKIYGVTNLGIADFRRVEQEVCCYVPGEVSHIENVMAREYKERSTRSLTSSEFTTEQTDERERENLTDTTSTERNEMQSEVASVLNEDQSQSYGGNANVSGEFPGGSRYSIGAHFDSASSSSSSNSNSQAQTYAQEVTERAMERIVQKTQTKRTSRILKEFEENTSHGFDNRKGIEHVTGVYRWVDKIYKNTLINYGKRLMYEFAIPEPSKFFQEAVWKDFDTTGQVDSGIILPEVPLHPSECDISSASDLNSENYQIVASKYNAEVAEIPSEIINISTSFGVDFSGNVKDDGAVQLASGKGEMDIPEGYTVTEADFAYSVYHHSYKGTPKASITIGGKKSIQTTGNTQGEGTLVDLNAHKTLGYSFSAGESPVMSGSIKAYCTRTPELLEQWKNETYNAIMEAYYDRLQEYNDAIREKEANSGLTPEEERLTFNPLQNKSIMLRELKRVAIELLIDKSRVSRNNFDDMDMDTGVSPVKRGEAFQTHASTVKFFEQAFDWDIMAYVFYPYFYAAEKDWKKLFQLQDAADPLFQAFLQSGMARTVVPVRPGFEDAVNWYMTTGEIWNGHGLVVDQEDDLYISIAEEMQTAQGKVEGTWETRLPTALTIIQAGSIGLDVEGLPCNEDCALELFDTDDNPIAQNQNLIGGDDGVGSDYVSEPITVQ